MKGHDRSDPRCRESGHRDVVSGISRRGFLGTLAALVPLSAVGVTLAPERPPKTVGRWPPASYRRIYK